jgi:hypothetical protein
VCDVERNGRIPNLGLHCIADGRGGGVGNRMLIVEVRLNLVGRQGTPIRSDPIRLRKYAVEP